MALVGSIEAPEIIPLEARAFKMLSMDYEILTVVFVVVMVEVEMLSVFAVMRITVGGVRGPGVEVGFS